MKMSGVSLQSARLGTNIKLIDILAEGGLEAAHIAVHTGRSSVAECNANSGRNPTRGGGP